MDEAKGAPPVASADVAVLGLWHLGCVSAAGWSRVGKRVVAWDPDPALRAAVRAATCPVAEPGVDAELRAGLDRGTLDVVDDPAATVRQAPVTHLAFDTGVDHAGRPNDPRLDEAVRVFAADAVGGALLLVSSQVPAGTCASWKALVDAEARGLLLAHAPENLRLGRALEDFLHPPRLLVGADDEAAYGRAAEALAPLGTPLRVRLASAEMAKHGTNAYLALCIAFANDLAWLSLAEGADPAEVAAALRADPRVSPSAPLRPGPAFSGATLARDLAVLRDVGQRCGRGRLFEAVVEANERHAESAVTWLEDALGSLRGTRLAVAGLTYKPGTSTLRDSLPLRLVSRFLDRGARVAAWDPLAEPLEPRAGLTRTLTLEECVRGADALAVLTALPELRAVDWRKLRPARRLVVDGCMGVDRRAVEAAGWAYRGLSPA